MNDAFRIIDVNTNRVCEGIRVLEAYFRFVLNDADTLNFLRTSRHLIRKSVPSGVLQFRDSENDIGLNISQNNQLDNKKNLHAILTANLVRVQEGLRVLEEYYKIVDLYAVSKKMEVYRYDYYSLQSKVFKPVIKGIYALTKGGTYQSVVDDVKHLLQCGVSIIQFRDKENDVYTKLKIAKTLRTLTRQYHALFIVNDDLDIAMAVGADGIHLGQDDMSVQDVKALAPKLLIGLSTHNKTQFKQALDMPLDYIAVGPIFKTHSKLEVEHCEGISFAKWAREHTRLPLVAIGGINSENITALIEIEIDACAMISALDSVDNVMKLLTIFKERNECIQLKWMQQKKALSQNK